MLERDVAAAFNTMFKEYGVLAPINNSQSGWPDRFVQTINSVVVAAEIKLVQLLKSGDMRLAEFRPTQAAWLAKWQRNNGKCFLFLGINDFNEAFLGYGILTVTDWKEWVQLSNALVRMEELDFMTNETQVITDWFRAYTEFAYA